jgi:hypothetical protein
MLNYGMQYPGEIKTMSTMPVDATPPGEPKPIIPPLAASYAHSRDLAWLIIRLTAGGMLLVHGIMKVMPMAERASPPRSRPSPPAAWPGAGTSRR